MSCSTCADMHLKKFKKHPKCAECLKPHLDYRNEVAWETWEMAANQVRTAGMGQVIGLDYAALPLVFDCLGIEGADKYVTLLKLVVIQKVAGEQQRRAEEDRKAHAKYTNN